MICRAGPCLLAAAVPARADASVGADQTFRPGGYRATALRRLGRRRRIRTAPRARIYRSDSRAGPSSWPAAPRLRGGPLEPRRRGRRPAQGRRIREERLERTRSIPSRAIIWRPTRARPSWAFVMRTNTPPRSPLQRPGIGSGASPGRALGSAGRGSGGRHGDRGPALADRRAFRGGDESSMTATSTPRALVNRTRARGLD